MPMTVDDPDSQAVQRLRTAILHRISALLRVERIDPASVSCDLDMSPWSLRVDLVLPAPVSRSAQDAFAVCVMDAIRSGGQTVGTVDIHAGPRSSGPLAAAPASRSGDSGVDGPSGPAA